MSCYSDHNEDIRTKGSCDYCGGTEPELDPCAWCGLDLADHDRNERTVCESQHRLHLGLSR